MAASTNRYSTYTSVSVGSGSDSNSRNDDSKNGDKAEKEDLWSSMLSSVESHQSATSFS